MFESHKMDPARKQPVRRQPADGRVRIAGAMRMKARLVSFGFGLLFHLQDARS
jgi:hypothetical protein